MLGSKVRLKELVEMLTSTRQLIDLSDTFWGHFLINEFSIISRLNDLKKKSLFLCYFEF